MTRDDWTRAARPVLCDLIFGTDWDHLSTTSKGYVQMFVDALYPCVAQGQAVEVTP